MLKPRDSIQWLAGHIWLIKIRDLAHEVLIYRTVVINSQGGSGAPSIILLCGNWCQGFQNGGPLGSLYCHTAALLPSPWLQIAAGNGYWQHPKTGVSGSSSFSRGHEDAHQVWEMVVQDNIWWNVVARGWQGKWLSCKQQLALQLKCIILTWPYHTYHGEVRLEGTSKDHLVQLWNQTCDLGVIGNVYTWAPWCSCYFVVI